MVILKHLRRGLCGTTALAALLAAAPVHFAPDFHDGVPSLEANAVFARGGSDGGGNSGSGGGGGNSGSGGGGNSGSGGGGSSGHGGGGNSGSGGGGNSGSGGGGSSGHGGGSSGSSGGGSSGSSGGSSSGSGGGSSSGSSGGNSGPGGGGSSGHGGGGNSGPGGGGSSGSGGNSGPGGGGSSGHDGGSGGDDHGGNSGRGGGDDHGRGRGGDDDRGGVEDRADRGGTKVEVEGNKIEVTFGDGTKREIENGRFEQKDATGRTIVERPATPEDVAQLRAAAGALRANPRATGGTKVEVDGDNIEVTFADGTKQEIENGRFEQKNAAGRTIVERPATAEDVNRLKAAAGTLRANPRATGGTKVEVDGDNIEVTFADGTKQEIENGRFERKNAAGRTIVERPATAEDVNRLKAAAGALGANPRATGGTKVEVDGDNIEVTFADGTKQEIENGRFEQKNAAGRTIVERPATAEDVNRLQAAAAASTSVGMSVSSKDAHVEVSGRDIEVTHADGWREEIENERYELKDPNNNTVVERAARRDDRSRLESLLDF